jgi:hypothetical protein
MTSSIVRRHADALAHVLIETPSMDIQKGEGMHGSRDLRDP